MIWAMLANIVGLIAAVYLIGTNDPGSLMFAWGVAFAVVNGAMMIVAAVRS